MIYYKNVIWLDLTMLVARIFCKLHLIKGLFTKKYTIHATANTSELWLKYDLFSGVHLQV